MYHNAEKNAFYIAHPRTASSATGYQLMRMGFIQVASHHRFDADKFKIDSVVFTTIRHHFAVMVSWYKNSQREFPFKEWLPIFLRDCHYLQGADMFWGLEHATHILKFENLQGGFDSVMEEIGIPTETIPHRNVSKQDGSHYFDWYDKESTDFMMNHFGDEMEKLNYKGPPCSAQS